MEERLNNATEGLLHDRYQIQQILGQSEERQTLLAHDLLTQEQVVIKLLSHQNDRESKNVQLFQREAETLKTLCHPAIPHYLDFFELDWQGNKNFALVQSYVPGKSLQRYLNEGRIFNEFAIQQIATQLLNILIYLHGKQPPIIHRDIKLSNILITSQPDKFISQVYLVDFGSVQNFDPSAIGSFTVVGTYGYTAPEQLSGRPVKASDLYSLGIALIHAMTGVEPAKLPRKGRKIEFKSLLTGSPTFINWLRRMTELSLEHRFPSAQIALQALEQPPSNQSTVPQKPINTRVSLTKNRNSLQVSIPATIGKLRLSVDDRQMLLTHEMMGWRYNQLPPIQKLDLRKLKFTQEYLIIWAVTRRYQLSIQLTDAELNWLVHELKQWLKLPVSGK